MVSKYNSLIISLTLIAGLAIIFFLLSPLLSLIVAGIGACVYFLLQSTTLLDVPNQNQVFLNRRSFLLGLMISTFGAFSMLVLYRYYYAPPRIYTNASHHLFQKLGFNSTTQVDFINGVSPNRAIWSEKTGNLSLRAVGPELKLTHNNVVEPLFLQEGDQFKLVNASYSQGISNALKLDWNDGIGMELKLEALENSKTTYTYRVFDADSTSEWVELPYKQTFGIGYPLGSLLLKTPQAYSRFDSVYARLGDGLLIRSVYTGEDDNDAPLVFFPDRNISTQPEVSVNGEIVNTVKTSSEITFEGTKKMFLGIKKTSTEVYRLEKVDDILECMLDLPEMYYLYDEQSEEEQQILVTSNLKNVISNENKKVFLFGGVADSTSLLHFSGSLNYAIGSTKDAMNFSYVPDNQNSVSVDESIQFLAADTITIGNQADFKWLFKIEDRKAANPMTAKLFFGYQAIFILLCLLMVLSTPANLMGKTQIIEASVYLFLITLLSIRSILFWRASTFIPVEGISKKVWDIFTQDIVDDYFIKYQFILTAFFFTAICAFKYYRGYKQRIGTKTTPNQWLLKPAPLLITLLLVMLYGSNFAIKVAFPVLERFSNVLIPLIIYFTSDYFLQKRALLVDKFVPYSNEYKIFSLVNWLLCMLSFAVLDTGFTLLFTMFTILYHYIKFVTFPDEYGSEGQSKNKFWQEVNKFRYILFSASFLGFVIFSDRLIAFAFRNPQLVVISVGVLCCIYFWAFFKITTRKKLMIVSAITVFTGVVYIFGGSTIEKVLAKNNRMLYRAEILHKSADEIIEAEAFQGGNDTRLLNAAQNKWIIDYYADKSDIIPTANTYFNLQPHFQRGSSYLTQLSDLVAVRYLLAEHGILILLGILLFIALLLSLNVRYSSNFNVLSKLRTGVLVLLFVIAYAIWLTSTNRLVFIGQDFPMLSINSIMSLVFGFVSLAFVVISSYQNEYYNAAKFDAKFHQTHLSTFNQKSGEYIFTRYFSSLLVVTFIAFLFQTRSTASFDLNDTISKLEGNFQRLNSLFLDFQSDQSFKNEKEAMKAFDEHISATGQKKSILSGENQTFFASAYEALKNKLILTNSSENLIHIKKDIFGKYNFAVNGFYYTTNNPDTEKVGWKGNLIEANQEQNLGNLTAQNIKWSFSPTDVKTASSTILQDVANNNIFLSYLPSGWAPTNDPVYIVGSTFGNFSKNRSKFRLKSGKEQFTSASSPFAFIANKGDILNYESTNERKNITISFNGSSKHFFAKTVWLNGREQFVYPLEDKFLWPYQFANSISEFNRSENKRTEQDIELTLDFDLAQSLSAIFKKHYGNGSSRIPDKGGSVTVLDSDGAIYALTDYDADAPFRIDPNRTYKFRDQIDDLYMNPDRTTERRVFGNNNLLLMPLGPGSTFKPLLYGSITSQFDMGWENLSFGGIGNYPAIQEPDGDKLIKHLGGKWGMALTSGGPFESHSNYEYLLRSTNSYNGMVLFLGSFSSSQLSGIFTNSSFLARGYSEKPEENYPLIDFREQTYHVTDFPQWSDPKAIFHQGLWLNFNLPFSRKQAESIDTKKSYLISKGLNDAYLVNSTSSYTLWSQPNQSQLLAIDRDVDLSNAISNIAMGGYPIQVTPLKMAEMVSGLFSMSADFNASVIPRESNKKPFDFGNWKSENDLANFYITQIFRPLNDVPLFGTIRSLSGLSNRLSSQGIYLYAKTGTISAGKGNQDKNLILVLSKGKVDSGEIQTAEDLRNNKFVVLYFNFRKEGLSQPISLIEASVKEVMNSKRFKQFMQ